MIAKLRASMCSAEDMRLQRNRPRLRPQELSSVRERRRERCGRETIGEQFLFTLNFTSMP
jgi:hypothetical protein